MGRVLNKLEQKFIMGGNPPGEDDGETCCTQVSECPPKSGYSVSCNNNYNCSTGNKKKCIWVRVS